MKKQLQQSLYWLVLAILIILAYKIIDSISFAFDAFNNFISLIMPFILAALLAYILYRPAKAIEEAFLNSKFKFLKKHRRGLAVLTIYFIVALVIFIILDFVIPAVSGSIVDLANNLPNYYNSAIKFLKNLPEDSIWAKLEMAKVVSNIENFNISETIMEWVNLENISGYLKGIVGAAKGIFDVFIVIVVSIYILLERHDIKNFVSNLSNAIFSKNVNAKMRDIYYKTNNIFSGFITGQLIDALVVGIIAVIVMNIMGIKYATLLGTLIAIFNIIPYFGAIVAISLACLITIFTDGFATALWMTLIIIIIQQLDANILNPRILGTSLNVSPILVIFSVTVGGAYFGVFGMFLGVPVAALIKVLLSEYIKSKNERKEKVKVEND